MSDREDVGAAIGKLNDDQLFELVARKLGQKQNAKAKFIELLRAAGRKAVHTWLLEETLAHVTESVTWKKAIKNLTLAYGETEMCNKLEKLMLG